EVVDVSDVTSPTLVATHRGLTNYNKVVMPVPGRRLLFSGSSIFEVESEGESATKRELGKVGVWAFDVATSGGVCYIASSLDALHVVDCGEPEGMRRLAKL